MYSNLLRIDMKNILKTIKNNAAIKDGAEQYQKEISQDMEKATCSVSLSDQERQKFLEFLTQNGCELNPFMQTIISTQMIV